MRPKFLLAFLLLSTPLLAQFQLHMRNAEDVYADQRRAVGSWCRQDFMGFRLSDHGWDKYKTLTNLKHNPESPAVVIVSRYQVGEHDPKTISWDVNVTYFVVGRYDHATGYSPTTGSETVTFQTKDIDDNIVVVALDPTSPHVSKIAALTWMKQQLASTTSDIEKIHLSKAIQQLEPPSAEAATKSAQ
ncbi:MAG TPA: hypothetical protein VFU86_03215 [Terriglobales bacterium]|nr:hypothetical protein [Terriglobales bacterium]